MNENILSNSHNANDSKDDIVESNLIESNKQNERKILKIASVSNTFKSLVTYDIFVDKSIFIEEILDFSKENILITRPRRWGKSLNMNMLKIFLETDGNNPDLYTNDGKYDFSKINKNNHYFKT